MAKSTNSERTEPGGSSTFEEMVPEHYHSFRDLFSKESFDELPERRTWDHAIELIPNAKSTLDCKVYPLNRNEQEQLDKFLDENLEDWAYPPLPNLLSPPPSSLLRKKMGHFDPYRTTASSTR